MMRNALILCLSLLLTRAAIAQRTDTIDGRVVTLSEVIIRSGTDVKGFINRVKEDTSFYKAFRNLRVLNFSSLNDIRMMDKKGRTQATLNSRTRNQVSNGCRRTIKEAEQVTGDFYNRDSGYNYYTASLYASLFFAFEPVCGETNVVAGTERSLAGKSGMEKHKEQLKMLFFNPGMRIPGIPLMGNKAALFDDELSGWYDFSVDIQDRAGRQCYVFSVKAKDKDAGGDPDKVVIDEMTTWFDYKTFQVLARNYALSYSAGVYSFDVDMQVEISPYKNLMVPTVIRYNGNWKVVMKGRERGVFTATLFDFVD
jgi:hypothetical protein